MQVKPRSKLVSGSAARARLGGIVLVMGSLASCTAYPTIEQRPVDCTADSAYDVQVVDAFEPGTSPPVWAAADQIDGGATATAALQAISDAPRCGSTAALLIHARHNNDWGSLAGYGYGATFGRRDYSDFDGMSFWARAPGNTTKAFTIALKDPNTYDPTYADPVENDGIPGMDTDPTDSYCRAYAEDVAGGGGGTSIDPNGNIIPGSGNMDVRPPDACGNDYTAIVVATPEWRFYTLPFARFQQAATANRVPSTALTHVGSEPGSTILSTEILGIGFRMPKEAVMDLWIDNLGFYRNKSAPARDGGVDAAKM